MPYCETFNSSIHSFPNSLFHPHYYHITDMKNSFFPEYPVQLKSLAWDITYDHIKLNSEGEVEIPDKPGLGMEVDVESIRPYLCDVTIDIDGKELYKTPSL